jgi:DNA-binding MarR family transcriptional regulator
MSTKDVTAPDGPSTAQLFRTAYNLLSQAVFNHLAASGFGDLRPAHGNVLERLTYVNEARLSVMASKAGMTAQSMGELVDDLEQRGYLTRRNDPADRRAKLVRLTAKGSRVSAAAAEAVAAEERRLETMLGPQGHARVRTIVSRIIENSEPRRDAMPAKPAGDA